MILLLLLLLLLIRLPPMALLLSLVSWWVSGLGPLLLIILVLGIHLLWRALAGEHLALGYLLLHSMLVELAIRN